MKFCIKCWMDKNKEEFYDIKSSKDGLSHYCKNCYKIYYFENKQRISNVKKQWYKNTKKNYEVFGGNN